MVFFECNRKILWFFGQLALRGRMLREGPMDEGCKQRGSSTIFVKIKIFLSAIRARSASGIRNAPTVRWGESSKETRNFKRKKQSLCDQSSSMINPSDQSRVIKPSGRLLGLARCDGSSLVLPNILLTPQHLSI